MDDLTLKLKLISSSTDSGLATATPLSPSLPCRHTQTEKTTYLEEHMSFHAVTYCCVQYCCDQANGFKTDLVISTLFHSHRIIHLQ